MLLSTLLHLPILSLLPLLLSAHSSPQSNLANLPSPSPPPPRSLYPNTPSTGDHFTLGPFKVFLLKTVAILPIATVAEEIADFFNRRRSSRQPAEASQAGNRPVRLRVRGHQDISEYCTRGAVVELGSGHVHRIAASADDGVEVDGSFCGAICGSDDECANGCDFAGGVGRVGDDCMWIPRRVKHLFQP